MEKKITKKESKANKGCPHGCSTCEDWICNSYEDCNYEYEMDKD